MYLTTMTKKRSYQKHMNRIEKCSGIQNLFEKIRKNLTSNIHKLQLLIQSPNLNKQISELILKL